MSWSGEDWGGSAGASAPGSGGGGFDWMGLLAGILPGLGSLFGGDPMASSLQQMQQSESGMSSELMNMIGGMNNLFSKDYQPVIGAEGLSAMLGLGQTAGNLGASNSVYAQEAKTGLSPQVQANAMDQLLQGYRSSLSDIESQATPGSNTQAADVQAQDNYLTSAANQSAQLAGESQQYKNMGAQGLASNYGLAQQAAQGFTGQGIGLMGDSMSALSSLYNSMAQQSAAYAQQASQSQSPLGGIGSILGSILPFFG